MTPGIYEVIHKNLTHAFPQGVIEEPKDSNPENWRFKVVLLKGRSLLVAFSREFIGDSTPDQIQAAFDNWRIVDLMRENPDKRILVTTAGATLEKRE